MLYPPGVKGDLAHRLLGLPNAIQSETMDLECEMIARGLSVEDYDLPAGEELAAAAAEWRLLLQLDSDRQAKMNWGDAGRLYFWIRKQDLAQRHFEKVWMMLQCL